MNLCQTCAEQICQEGKECPYGEAYFQHHGNTWHGAYLRLPRRYRQYISLLDSILLIPFFADGSDILKLRKKGFDVTGIEKSKYALKNIRPEVTEFVHKGDVEDLDYPDNSFDIIMTRYLLEHLSDPVPALRELHRVARRFIYVGVTSRDDKQWEKDPSHLCKLTYKEWTDLIKNLDLFYIRSCRKTGGGEWLLEPKKENASPPPDILLRTYQVRAPLSSKTSGGKQRFFFNILNQLHITSRGSWHSYEWKPSGKSFFIFLENGFVSIRFLPQNQKIQIDIRAPENNIKALENFLTRVLYPLDRWMVN